MIRHYLVRNRGVLALSTLLSLASGALSLALLARLNRLAREGLTSGRPSALLSGLGLVLAVFLTNLLAQTCMSRMSAATTADLRRELAERFLALDYERLMGNRHLVTTALISDVSRIAPLLLVAPQMVFNTGTVVFCLLYLGRLSPRLLAVFSVFMAFAVASSFFILYRTHAVFEKVHEAEGKLFADFRALAEGKKELTLNAARARHFLQGVIGEGIEKARRLAYAANKWWGFGESWWTAMIFCAILSVIYAGQGLPGMDPGTVLQFVIVALFMIGPVNFLIGTARPVTTGLASVRHLEAIGVAEDSPGSAPVLRGASPGAIAPGRWRTLTARGLGYRYPDDDGHGFVLGPVDLTVRRGEIVFIVGGNGSGKSTLALLLSGLVSPGEGRIEVDGMPVGGQERPAYRSLFTGVFVDFFLFAHVVDGTGSLAPDASINAWLARMDLSRKVRAKDGELSTLDLSQGQRKRIALAQSCIDDRDIYLFDEWAADQDREFRHRFYTELLPELKGRGKTALVITHDDRYFGVADRLVRLEQGKVVATEAVSAELFAPQ